jgi:hypothetical protein
LRYTDPWGLYTDPLFREWTLSQARQETAAGTLAASSVPPPPSVAPVTPVTPGSPTAVEQENVSFDLIGAFLRRGFNFTFGMTSSAVRNLDMVLVSHFGIQGIVLWGSSKQLTKSEYLMTIPELVDHFYLEYLVADTDAYRHGQQLMDMATLAAGVNSMWELLSGATKVAGMKLGISFGFAASTSGTAALTTARIDVNTFVARYLIAVMAVNAAFSQFACADGGSGGSGTAPEPEKPTKPETPKPAGTGETNNIPKPVEPHHADTNYLKSNGIDPHQLKKDTLGTKADISQFDVYIDRNDNLWLLKKGTSNYVPTYVKFGE